MVTTTVRTLISLLVTSLDLQVSHVERACSGNRRKASGREPCGSWISASKVCYVYIVAFESRKGQDQNLKKGPPSCRVCQVGAVCCILSEEFKSGRACIHI